MTMQCLMSTLPKHRRLRRRRNIYTIFFFFGVSSQLNLSCTSSEFQSAYTLALDSEDAAAQFNLGTMYDHGDGVEQSEEIVREKLLLFFFFFIFFSFSLLSLFLSVTLTCMNAFFTNDDGSCFDIAGPRLVRFFDLLHM